MQAPIVKMIFLSTKLFWDSNTTAKKSMAVMVDIHPPRDRVKAWVVRRNRVRKTRPSFVSRVLCRVMNNMISRGIAISRNPARWFRLTYAPEIESGEGLPISGYIQKGKGFRPKRLNMPMTESSMAVAMMVYTRMRCCFLVLTQDWVIK